jgi:hypothetical protein
MHLFSCSHPKQAATKQELLQLLSQSKLDNQLKPLITAAIKLATLETTWQPDRSQVPLDYKKGVDDQSLIGWQQTLQGCFAKSLLKGDMCKEQDLRQAL